MTTPYAFIPHKLRIEGEPRLSVFPHNIMFMSFGIKDGHNVTGTALYFPDLSLFFENEGERGLIYRNKYGRNSWIELLYYDKGKYEGTKYVNGKNVGMAFGKDWKNFFIHLTQLGLASGEECEFEEN